MKSTLLVVDVGNTNIVIGGFVGDELTFEIRLATEQSRTIDEYEAVLRVLLEQKLGPKFNFTGAIVSSVVPPVTPTIIKLLNDRFGVNPLVVGPGIKTGVAIKVPDPTSVGADRIVNSVAAKALFGTPALVIDFGTATTFDFISSAGAYEGGIIAPGPVIALESLVRNTAKLPRIELAWPKAVVGNSTVTAMQSGAVIGYLCLVDGLIDRICKEQGAIKHVIATGGLGRLYSEHSERIVSYDAQLTLKGMKIIFDLNQ